MIYLHPYSSRPKRNRLPVSRDTTENNLTECLRSKAYHTEQVGTFHRDITKQVRTTNTEYLEGLRVKFNQTQNDYSQICKTLDSKKKIEMLKQSQEQLAVTRQGINHRLLSRRKKRTKTSENLYAQRNLNYKTSLTPLKKMLNTEDGQSSY